MKSNFATKIRIGGYVAVLALAGSLLAACGGGSGSSSNPNPPPPPPVTNSFTAFVKTQLKQPGTAQPAMVNGVNFDFTDLNDPHAYDDVLPPPSSTGG